MTESVKTLIFIMSTALLCLGAYFLSPSNTDDAIFSDQGELFYPEFHDPLQVSSLEVVEYNEELARVSPFKVELKDGQWTIPSHSNYPVDAKAKMGKLAVSLIGLKRDEVRSDRPSNHRELKLIDPIDNKIQALTGRGTRLTLKDSQGRVLVDYILGKELDDRSGYRFVRLPGQNKSYAVKCSLELSTSFKDWINTELLSVKNSEINALRLSDYSIDQGKLIPGESYSLRKSGSNWSFVEPKDKQADKDKVSKILEELAQLKIIGVRAKPQGLASDLKVAKGLSLSEEAVKSLQSMGFYLTKERQLYSSEGEVLFHKGKGISYIIRFGNAFFGDKLHVSSGQKSEDSKETSEDSSANRYVFIMAQVDYAQLGEAPERGEKPKELEEAATEIEKDLYDLQLSFYESAEKTYKEWEGSVKKAEEEVAALNKRFADWYYVISGASYDKIRLPLSAVVKAEKKKQSRGL